MRRIYLSRDEKKILRELHRGRTDVPLDMDNWSYQEAVTRLAEIGFVRARINYDEVLDIKLLPKGKVYIRSNPHLVNPINWTAVAALGAWVAAAAALAALFIACTR